jgi:cytochrome c553
MPRLAGQREEFLAEMLLQYRQNKRPGGDTMMNATLYGIPERTSRLWRITSRD